MVITVIDNKFCPCVTIMSKSSSSRGVRASRLLFILAVVLKLLSSYHGPSLTPNGPFLVMWVGAAEQSDDLSNGEIQMETSCTDSRHHDDDETDMTHASYSSTSSSMVSQYDVPVQFESPFGEYPNLLNITEAIRQTFHSVIIYPNRLSLSVNGDAASGDRTATGISGIPVHDNRQRQGMASLEDIGKLVRLDERCNWLGRLWKRWKGRIFCRPSLSILMEEECSLFQQQWSIGKYYENRVGMYNSDLFDDMTNTIDGFSGRRTVHLGIDLGAPVGTPVWSFADGVVHSVGYNEQLGDYGHVIVVEHFWDAIVEETSIVTRVWALYGHLDKSVVNGGLRKPGDSIWKGQMIGRVGDSHENGGWKDPHVHFQLSLRPPDQPHDMPGASSVEDRYKALRQYPDPRYVLGPIYG